MKPFVTLGDLIADLYLGIERLPVEADRHQDVSGIVLGPGGAGNALVAAARLGLPAIALGGVGDDWVGQRVLGQLRAEGVSVEHVTWMPGEATAVAVVLRADDGAHVFLGYYGTRGPRTLPDRYRPILQSAGVVLVDGWTFRHDWPEMILAGAEMAARAGACVLFDPGPQLPQIDPAWLTAMTQGGTAHVLLMTEDEAHLMQGKVHLSGLQAVIVKRGASGCVISTADRTIDCPGYPVEVRDLTAAGDCFAAAVAWGILRGQPWEVIGAVANAVGAAKVQKIGTALAAPTRAEVAAILQQHRPELAGNL